MLPSSTLMREFQRVRAQSLQLCAPLETEDFALQAMPETSPPKWHLAHTTWFFDTFVLKPYVADYRPWNPAFEQLFNSYYNGVGEPFARARRGLLSRPSVTEVYRYREAVDQQILGLLAHCDSAGTDAEILRRVELGLHHEMQHQELLLTDLKYSFQVNPLKPVYRCRHQADTSTPARPFKGAVQGWQSLAGGLVVLGAGGDQEQFSFDNETPRHRQFLEPFALAETLVTSGEYREFIEDGGYQRAELWLADGWDVACRQRWQAPLYWLRRDGNWWEYGLEGEHALDEGRPVSHLSYYEADAFARWAGARLPTEAEWELAAADSPVEGNFLDSGHYRPRTSVNGGGLQQLFGDVWEWTASAYLPYPGYRPASGTLGEYNGKFMSNQMVLRGGSCASDKAHVRLTYRNFFYPADRWQWSGFRLCRSL